MPKRDSIHEAVKTALGKEDWTISDDPFTVYIEGSKVDVDLAAEKMIIAEKGIKKIAVEIKSSAKPSIISAFHEALGQYLDYRDIFSDYGVERDLYLAVSIERYKQMMNLPFVKRQIGRYNIKIIVVNVITETIEEWIE
ncbi:MAG: element excision factor XisH family protein [Bacteroidota bacterium]